MESLAVAGRFLLYLDLMALFGFSAFALYALRGSERVSGTVLPLAALVLSAASGGILLSVLGTAILAATLGGTGLSAIDGETLGVLLFDTSNGTALQIRIAVLIVALLSAWPLRRHKWATASAIVVTLAGGVGLASLAWGGHGAIGEGPLGWLQLGGDIVHLLAAGVWVGALGAMLLLVLRPQATIDREHLQLTHRVLDGFSVTGTIVVGLLVATGLLNLIVIVGWPGIAALPGSLYGQLLLAKLVLFIVMLGLAASNRFRLVPRFEVAMAADDEAGALSVLRQSLAVETGCVVAILLLVGWLGTLDPSGAM
ncbi:copper homeostasis membrane protein CopD [Sphingomonas sp.]|uniref:copper homeostasis membrane protein CopD n=1 Tax=Sphingomonas sp. TaxID=28214 RepID=UPI001ED32C8F|nr:copper homeostasis membrane protein CopD [Sphingomonas sp.]MBX3595247.1 copper homeostasis membrane protein CopD [Sphingomonas sp.]